VRHAASAVLGSMLMVPTIPLRDGFVRLRHADGTIGTLRRPAGRPAGRGEKARKALVG
jgi:hypothetical protein